MKIQSSKSKVSKKHEIMLQRLKKKVIYLRLPKYTRVDEENDSFNGEKQDKVSIHGIVLLLIVFRAVLLPWHITPSSRVLFREKTHTFLCVLAYDPQETAFLVAKNGDFLKRSPKWSDTKTPAFRFPCGRRKRRLSKTMTSQLRWSKPPTHAQ